MADDLDIVITSDPGTASFDNLSTPILTYEDHHGSYGSGWVLYYLDDLDSPTTGVDEIFIGGGFADLDWASKEARGWLHRMRGGAS